MNIIHRQLNGWDESDKLCEATLVWLEDNIGPVTLNHRAGSYSSWQAYCMDHYIEHVNPTHRYFREVFGWFGDEWSVVKASFGYSMGRTEYFLLTTIKDDLMAVQYKLVL